MLSFAPCSRRNLTKSMWGPPGVKTGIDMGEADGNEAGRSHDAGGLLHQLHGKLMGPASAIGPLNGDTGQGDIVGLAGTEERNFFQMHQDFWNHKIGSAAAFQPFGNGRTLGLSDGG
jgi:hypothetical protein